MNLTIKDASFHRNGVGGIGFYAILFTDVEQGEMVASIFEHCTKDGEDWDTFTGYCAVYKISELQKGNIEFANGNSWRGDKYESTLRPLLKEFLKKHGSNQMGPFAFPDTRKREAE